MTGNPRRWLVGAVLAALLLGGCGIPDNTPVLTVGPGPSMGVSSGGELAPTQHRRGDTADKSTFVRYYLEAAAGDPDEALKRAKAFLSPSADLTFKPPLDIRVVHLVENPLNNPGSDDVTLKYQIIGTLGQNGILDPTTADGTVERSTLVVGDVPGKTGLFLQKAPQYLMISDAALGAFYDQHTIYFWNTEHTGLVPDVRYMPLTVPAEQQPTMILSWLMEGPADWLHGTVEPLPDKAAVTGNVPAVSNGKLQINLNEQAVPVDDPKALDRLRRQLQWSLRPLLPRTLELRVGSEPSDYSDTDYLTSNFAYRLADAPQRFVVFDGHVRRMAASTHASEPVPVLTAAENSHVRTAALSSSGAEDFAALVVGEAKGKESLRVGSARPGQQAPLEKIALPAPIGHPTWAVTPDQTRNDAIGLVTAKGALYSFTADGKAQPVDWPGAPGGITAVSIAPDGHRVALVAGGRLYLTALTVSGDGMQLSDPQPIRTLLLREITAVGWSSEGWLAVAGSKPAADGGRATVMDMTIDGAQGSDRVTDLGDARVTYLAAYPANPTVTSQHANSVSYVAGNAGYDALQSGLKITVGNLAEPVPNPPAGVVPTAPFFLN
jgi:hypothetical protein